MQSPLPKAEDFTAFDTVGLTTAGELLDGRRAVPAALVSRHLARLVDVPPWATDVFLFVHGWQNTGRKASAGACRLFSAIADLHGEQGARYPRLADFRPYFVAVQWPARSNPLPEGYRRIRDRAHEMTSAGHAAQVVAALLCYLDVSRRRPGQYVHCVAHSVGCALLGEALLRVGAPPSHPTLEWPWPAGLRTGVDTFVGFQMATAPDVFRTRFRRLVEPAGPVAGPVVLTVSPHDRALSIWHRLPEHLPGLGAVGATAAHTIELHQVDRDYGADEFAKLTNVEAGWLYRRGSPAAQGAHSDIWYPESIHLLLSLASLSR